MQICCIYCSFLVHSLIGMEQKCTANATNLHHWRFVYFKMLCQMSRIFLGCCIKQWRFFIHVLFRKFSFFSRWNVPFLPRQMEHSILKIFMKILLIKVDVNPKCSKTSKCRSFFNTNKDISQWKNSQIQILHKMANFLILAKNAHFWQFFFFFSNNITHIWVTIDDQLNSLTTE